MTSPRSHNLSIGLDLKRTNYQDQPTGIHIVNMCKLSVMGEEIAKLIELRLLQVFVSVELFLTRIQYTLTRFF